MRVTAVNAAVLRTDHWTGTVGRSGIDKRPRDTAIEVGPLGLVSDLVCDPSHGGLEQALYTYAREDARWWERELGRQLPPGSFGENLSTENLDVNGAVIGQRWRIGDTVVVQVTLPRIPCRTFAGFWGVPDLIKRFIARATPGAYLRVVVPGHVRAGDPITIQDHPAHGVTVQEAFRAITTEPDLLTRLAEIPDPPAKLAEKVRRRVREAG